MKRFNHLLFFLVLSEMVVSPAVFAMDDDVNEFDAADQARQAHEHAATDMIYQQDEWKALYYQNMQIIQLLKEIRDLVQAQNQRAAKAEQGS